eukprot:CAMPEP_0171936706 /NCGR_PEP_ID=MMETSP0993-20121228/33993_1 /TAXON_ID=483369 /ORGANISM="non described non described, Strain CCMP2098" /LENGTH=250 /DNA_ID=CAMNT_0012577917 /DNA_START=661 /DNA_END=1413 /DNA_ORIENTATION=+
MATSRCSRVVAAAACVVREAVARGDGDAHLRGACLQRARSVKFVHQKHHIKAVHDFQGSVEQSLPVRVVACRAHTSFIPRRPVPLPTVPTQPLNVVVLDLHPHAPFAPARTLVLNLKHPLGKRAFALKIVRAHDATQRFPQRRDEDSARFAQATHVHHVRLLHKRRELLRAELLLPKPFAHRGASSFAVVQEEHPRSLVAVGFHARPRLELHGWSPLKHFVRRHRLELELSDRCFGEGDRQRKHETESAK